jgi:hypothetical protein
VNFSRKYGILLVTYVNLFQDDVERGREGRREGERENCKL